MTKGLLVPPSFSLSLPPVSPLIAHNLISPGIHCHEDLILAHSTKPTCVQATPQFISPNSKLLSQNALIFTLKCLIGISNLTIKPLNIKLMLTEIQARSAPESGKQGSLGESISEFAAGTKESEFTWARRISAFTHNDHHPPNTKTNINACVPPMKIHL